MQFGNGSAADFLHAVAQTLRIVGHKGAHGPLVHYESFHALNDLDGSLSTSKYLLGNELSILDVAWYVYVNRLLACGYPLSKLHGHVSQWFEVLNDRKEFNSEVAPPPPVLARSKEIQETLFTKGSSLGHLLGA